MDYVSLATPLKSVLGAAVTKKIYTAFGYETVENLLNHGPRRYQDRGELTPLMGLREGEVVTVYAEVKDAKPDWSKDGKKHLSKVEISDGINSVHMTWFNQPFRLKELRKGVKGMFSGLIKKYRDEYQLSHPDYEVTALPGEEDALDDPLKAQEWAQIPVPIYPATAKLSSLVLQKQISKVLDRITDLDDPIPASTLKLLIDNNEAVITLTKAYEEVHRPKYKGGWREALHSLKFREAFELQLGLLYRKLQIQAIQSIPRLKVQGGFLDRFDAALPYTLTGDQEKVGHTIMRELENGAPMHRLLQGEVGSGKTLVALRAMLQVADTHGQAVLLAPTEVLASQHLRSIKELLGPELTKELNPTLLTGQLSVKERRSANLALASGSAKLIVGTHALMSEDVTFTDLGLIVIDEQHRFGVDQRETLRQKAKLPPNVLVMTATPIPRTVALTVFGDLEISTLKEMPAGRAKIESFVVPLAEKPGWLNRAWARAAEEIKAGRQVYVVCPAISPKETEGIDTVESVYDFTEATKDRALNNVEETLETVRLHPHLKEFRSAALTGAMTSEEKDSVMRDFADGKINILVATTVIEVGVNVPNASLMIVFDADRFGISQLHQLRGRVGRGTHAGVCLFVTPMVAGSTARKRVEGVAETLDGFKLAQLDLEMRREGDVLGSSQSGTYSSLKWLKVVRDTELIETAGKYARRLIAVDPQLNSAVEYRAKFLEMDEINRIAQINRS